MSTASSDTLLAQMMGLHPKEIDLTLDRMWRILDALGNPQDSLPPVIHIAGTNGKGSVQAMLRAGLRAAGKTVHAYTSPHLVRFHERIVVQDAEIGEDALCDQLQEVLDANAGQDITFFESTTAAALLQFSRVPADYLLLEVGMGGRLDSTNVIDQPALSIITPVDLDHQAFLGDTLGEIAVEKAAILKRNCFGVIGPQQDAALDVIERQAARFGTTLKTYGQHWHVWEENGRLVYQDEYGLLDLPMPNLIGAHQVQNGGTVVAAMRLLGCQEPEIAAALTQAEWPARMQRITSGPLTEIAPEAEIWLDGGHNPAAGAVIAKTLAGLQDRPLVLIAGMMNTKDAPGFFAPLGPDKVYGVTIPDTPNTLSAEDTVAAAQSAGLQAEVSADVATAVMQIAQDTPEARIFICGSLYLAGAVLRDVDQSAGR